MLEHSEKVMVDLTVRSYGTSYSVDVADMRIIQGTKPKASETETLEEGIRCAEEWKQENVAQTSDRAAKFERLLSDVIDATNHYVNCMNTRDKGAAEALEQVWRAKNALYDLAGGLDCLKYEID